MVKTTNVRPGRNKFTLWVRSLANSYRTWYVIKYKHPWVRFNGEFIRIKYNTKLWSPHHDITLGDRIQFGDGCAILCDIEMGSSILCANNVRFVGKDDHLIDKPGISIWESGRGDNYKTYVGSDVWFGENVTIIGGVHIGDGAIIAAGSVVTKDVAPCTVVGGNPARFIRNRFDNEVFKNIHMEAIKENFILRMRGGVKISITSNNTLIGLAVA